MIFHTRFGACRYLALAAALVTLVVGTASGVDTARVTVTINSEQVIGPIPTNFTGLSYEKAVLATQHFAPTNAVLVNLFSNLGVGVLRFSGNTVEETFWSREAGAVFPKARAVLGPAELKSALAFAKKIHWPVILGLNLGANNPAMVADEAAFACASGGNQLLAFEIGNEPEQFGHNGHRGTNYTYADFRSEVAACVSAIHQRTARVPLAGPATTSNFGWFDSFLTDFKAETVLATRHHYPLTAAGKVTPENPRYCTVENLLSQATAASSMKLLEQYEQAAAKAGVPFRVGETSSASLGGKNGVSDAFASALWCVDYMFALAAKGVEGVNFHGYFSCRGYTPFCFTNGHYHIHPIYYGLLFFQQAARGNLVVVRQEKDRSANVTSYAALGADGRLCVVLINKEAIRPAIIRVQAGSRYKEANVVRMAAPSVMAREGVTLGGAAVQTDGTWSPAPAASLACMSGELSVELPPASAALVVLQETVNRQLSMNRFSAN